MTSFAPLLARHLAIRAAAKPPPHLLSWIVGFGGIGLFVVAVADSSMNPLPLIYVGTVALVIWLRPMEVFEGSPQNRLREASAPPPNSRNRFRLQCSARQKSFSEGQP